MTSTCTHCGQPIRVAASGLHHKWITGDRVFGGYALASEWHCYAPGFPTRGHSPLTPTTEGVQ